MKQFKILQLETKNYTTIADYKQFKTIQLSGYIINNNDLKHNYFIAKNGRGWCIYEALTHYLVQGQYKTKTAAINDLKLLDEKIIKTDAVNQFLARNRDIIYNLIGE